MAIDLLQPGVTNVGSENGEIQWVHIIAGGALTFGVLALEKWDNDDGVITFYYWPSTAGVLRYGTTMPTTATQDSAGVAVGTDA